jgi:hypothetical protein
MIRGPSTAQKAPRTLLRSAQPRWYASMTHCPIHTGVARWRCPSMHGAASEERRVVTNAPRHVYAQYLNTARNNEYRPKGAWSAKLRRRHSTMRALHGRSTNRKTSKPPRSARSASAPLNIKMLEAYIASHEIPKGMAQPRSLTSTVRVRERLSLITSP